MHKTARVLTGMVVIGLCCLSGWAEMEPAGIFGDNMVLQRDIAVPVWGWGQAGEDVTVEFAGQKVSAKTDVNGKWMVRLSPIPASAEGREMVIRGTKNTVTFENIVVGEVWICSGQSNMEFPVGGSLNAPREITEANYPQIRQIAVARSPNVNLSKDTSGQWVICSPNSVGGFTAVGYFFGRDLFKALGVPVGLINSSWGGTHAETWTPQDTLRAKNINPGMVKFYDECVANFEAATKEYQEQVAKQERLKNEGKLKDRQEDPGNAGFEKGWAKADFDDTAWESIPLPRMCEFLQGDDGAVWFRRTVMIPDAWAGKDVKLCLGPIDDYDVTYYNGRQIGATDKTCESWWTKSRIYTIPGKLVTPGRAVIAVRVFDDLMGGGFNGSTKDMKLVGSDGSLPLDGDWKYQVEVILSPDNLVRSIAPPLGPNNADAPGSLYGGMIHPLIPYAIRGAIWYQGESNCGRAGEYVNLLSTMISEWRTRWGQGEFPFGIVQLANFMSPQNQPIAIDGWTLLREAQADIVKTVPNTGLAVAVDIGDANDIHPKNKQDVGKRLSLWALATVYGKKDMEYSGPVYKDMKIEGDTIRLLFDHAAGGLIAKGQKLTGFAIAGEDGEFHWADATIDGQTVVVSSPDVPAPRQVHYGMACNPPVNLYNKAGLPAVPFRTSR